MYLNIQLCCENNKRTLICDGIKTKICLNKKYSTESDIGSKIKGRYLFRLIFTHWWCEGGVTTTRGLSNFLIIKF